MDKKEVYRVKEGKLVGKNIEVPIHFGLIFEEDGIYSVEIYTPESVDLNALADEHINDYFNAFFITEDKNELEIVGLDITNIAFEPRRVEFICDGHLIYKDISWRSELPAVHEAELFFLELEGLKMEFSDLTYKSESRNMLVTKNTKADHSYVGLHVDQRSYTQIFRKSNVNDNIIVEFHNEPNNGLHYKTFLDFKRDYISLLSFFNGAEVRVRKEKVGNVVTQYGGESSTRIIITHSFRKIRNESYNKYIPLGYRIQNRNPNMLNQVMVQNFDKFREWNKKVDLSSIIFYLNGAEAARSLEEKFFIQIIAFERLTTLYAEQSGTVDQHLPSTQDFATIRAEFYTLLQKHQSSFGVNYEKARSVLGNLHEMKRVSTKEKMYGILNDTQITVDDDLRELINIVRNKAVHKGEVAEGQRSIVNLVLLNELLQEIIIKLIEYKGPRVSRALLNKTLFAPPVT